MRVILIGKSSGRLDCLAEAIVRSRNVQLFILTNATNPGLHAKGFVTIGPTEDLEFIATYASIIRSNTPTLAIISNEEALAAGVADILRALGIPTVGPGQAAAQIEWSKIYTRYLLQGNRATWGVSPECLTINPEDVDNVGQIVCDYNARGKLTVIKPEGLTGGKGVRIQGDHFINPDDAMLYAMQLREQGQRALIEERLIGQEFSRMCFSDGETVIPMPAVQDHKRLKEGDLGINTGGMGSYSDADHSLPFLTQADLDEADRINAAVVERIEWDTRHPYIGVLYGNFIATADGVKVIEYNCRFGDPEIMNVLPLLENDFVDLCYAVATKGLSKIGEIKFANRATVCKYLIPEGYPNATTRGQIDLSEVESHPNLRIYYGALDGDTMTGSRALAVVGIGKTLSAAERVAERAAQQVSGPVYHRRDIGTTSLIERRVDHMKKLRVTDPELKTLESSVV